MPLVIERIKEAVTIKNLLGINREALVDFVIGLVNRTIQFTTYFLLATLFSFLILLDFPNLRARVYALHDRMGFGASCWALRLRCTSNAIF